VLVLTLRPGQSLDVGRIRLDLLDGGWSPRISLNCGHGAFIERMSRGKILALRGVAFMLLYGSRNQCRIGIEAPQHVKIGRRYATPVEAACIQGVL
jgi:hypothetical protein